MIVLISNLSLCDFLVYFNLCHFLFGNHYAYCPIDCIRFFVCVLKIYRCVLIIGLWCVLVSFTGHIYSSVILTLNNILDHSILSDSKMGNI